MFKIISVGWQCAQYLEQTLQSVLFQVRDDWQMAVIYDKSDDDGAALIGAHCAYHNAYVNKNQFLFQLNDQQNYAPHNQWDALHMLAPEDDDIVVWLDLDGDMLAHASVLDTLLAAYSDGKTLLTYGSYRAVPDPGTPPPISLIPEDVVASGQYRQDALYNGPRFNHLRTMKGRVAKSIPIQSFQWRQRPGEWYISGADYLWMISGLERVRERYKMLTEVLVIYNDANPYADNKMHMHETSACDIDFLGGVPLARL